MMNNRQQNQTHALLYLFIFLVIINWLYVIWIQYESNTISSAWITLLPLFGYFYFAFTFVASIELYHRTKLGLSLAYSIIIFGIICAVTSYGFAFKSNSLYGWVITPLLGINLLIILIMVFKQKNNYFSA